MEDQIGNPVAGQGKIIQIDEEQVKRRLDNLVRGTVEEAINVPLESVITERYRTRQISVEEAIVEMHLEAMRGPFLSQCLYERAAENDSQSGCMLKAIHAQESKDATRRKAAFIAECLRAMKLFEATKMVESGLEKPLSWYEFPSQHRVRIRTNNRLKRLMKENGRGMPAVGPFPDGQFVLLLAAAGLCYVVSKTWDSRIYLNMSPLNEIDSKRRAA
ncbi:transposase [Leptonema illini]|uniref:Uncharacterized protein n=1 Tax=Leptonema illini DSM 21528 TaxID=929563 RepID=H2CD50_9LEPT|nr:transposase [Leptonema illini]EHQ07526.1 hypothetical protein Lepil_2857 [Leptonema illini DSM 21528]